VEYFNIFFIDFKHCCTSHTFLCLPSTQRHLGPVPAEPDRSRERAEENMLPDSAEPGGRDRGPAGAGQRRREQGES